MNWKIHIAFRIALVVGLAVTAIARSARGAEGRAPDAEGTPATAPSTSASTALTPPKLVTFVQAPTPDAGVARLRQAAVEVDLELTIDAQGKVTDARVPAPAGPPRS